MVAAVVVVSLVIGLFVRSPREAVSQVVAVTALIVILLGPGEATGYGLERIWETLVGAAIAIVVAMVVWPPDPIAGLRDLVRDLGAEVVRDLDRIATLPGGPVADAEELLDERVRASMSTSGSIEVLDRASSALRWNPRHRGKREAFWPLAVQVRQLLATSRYARSMVWLMVAGAGGDRVPGWSAEATDAFAGALGQLAVGATAVAAGAESVPYDAYGKESVEGQGASNRLTFLTTLPNEWLPAIDAIHDRLSAGPARVVDVGCGTGWSSIAIARAYPSVEVDGFDPDETSIRMARRSCARGGDRRPRPLPSCGCRRADGPGTVRRRNGVRMHPRHGATRRGARRR